MSKLKFTIKETTGSGRSGKLVINNRQVQTPVLVHTGGELGKLTAAELAATGSQVVKIPGLNWWLNNTDQLDQLPDLHHFYHWKGLILVDQQTDVAYRLAKPRGRKKDGVRFHDPKTGTMKFYQPTDGLALQQNLGADIYQSFARWEDYYAPVDDLEATVDQSTAWLPTFSTVKEQTLVSITGAGLKRLRKKSIQQARSTEMAGFAIAGIDAGVTNQEFNRIVNEIVTMLSPDGLRYLPISTSLAKLLMAVLAGIDLIDSDLAAKRAREGIAIIGDCLTALHVDRYHLAFDSRLLDEQCECPTCRDGYTRATIHHLLVTNSVLGERLLLVHNLFKLNQLMEAIRSAITSGKLESFIQELLHNA